MVKGTTKSGFKYEVDKDQLTNVEFLELFAKMQNGDGMVVFELLEIVLGTEQKKKLYDHCRNKKGMVPVDAVTEEVTDIFTTLSEAQATKN